MRTDWLELVFGIELLLRNDEDFHSGLLAENPLIVELYRQLEVYVEEGGARVIDADAKFFLLKVTTIALLVKL